MKIQIIIFIATIFFILNTYYDGKFINTMKTWKKYYQMIGIAFIGLSIYLFTKNNPNNVRDLFTYTNNIIKYMPIDKDANKFISPLLNMQNNFPQLNNNNLNTSYANNINQNTQQFVNNYKQENKLLNSGKTTTKRSVSETKKKYVAAQQGWKCTHCKQQLPAWFEVDHKVRLEYGGSNHIDNLEALCRDCHGKKTAMENL